MQFWKQLQIKNPDKLMLDSIYYANSTDKDWSQKKSIENLLTLTTAANAARSRGS